MSTSRTEQAAHHGLSGSLGTLDIVFTVLAYNAPLTVITGFLPLIISKGNGLGAPITFLISGGIIALFAIGFTTMSRHLPSAGAFYAYIAAGLGRPLGLGSAFVAILAYLMLMIAIFLYGGVVYSSLSSDLLGRNPLLWWQWSLLLWLAVSILGYLRIALSARVLTAALIMEVVLVFCWELGVVSKNGLASLRPDWLGVREIYSGSLGVAILFGVSSFAGFEATAVFREEARNPETTVPRATYLTIFILTLTFSSAAYAFICGYGPTAALSVSSANPETATANSIGHFLGRAGSESVQLLVCSSVFACLLALQNILSRYVYSLSVDGTMHRGLSLVHPKYASPYRASLLVSITTLLAIIALATMAIDPFTGYGVLSGSGGYALLLLLILTSISVIAFFWNLRDEVGRWRTLYAPLASTVALAVTGWLATTNLGLLTGDPRSIVILPAVVLATIGGGTTYAFWLRGARPLIYQAIGRQAV